jgi:hypothetical protein
VSQFANFKKLEQKTYLSYQQDGLLDLIIGVGIICMGINEAMDTTIWSFVAIMLIIAYVPLKRRITFARIGFVKFNVKRRGLNMQLVGAVIMTVLFLLLFGMLFLMRSGSSQSSLLILWIRKGPLLLYALLGLIGFVLAGLITGLHRLFIYALLSLIIMFGGHFLNLPIFMAFLLLGGLILVIGIVLLLRFLRKHPIVEENHDL